MKDYKKNIDYEDLLELKWFQNFLKFEFTFFKSQE